MMVTTERALTIPATNWRTVQGHYELRVVICPEDDGGYSVHALYLPGCCSQGRTPKEAIENIKEAFQGVAESYRESGELIPWAKDPVAERTGEAMERWILVDA